jgi:hypothetical protein
MAFERGKAGCSRSVFDADQHSNRESCGRIVSSGLCLSSDRRDGIEMDGSMNPFLAR